MSEALDRLAERLPEVAALFAEMEEQPSDKWMDGIYIKTVTAALAACAAEVERLEELAALKKELERYKRNCTCIL